MCLAVADVRDFCIVFVTAVDPGVVKLLLLLASLESCAVVAVAGDSFLLAFLLMMISLLLLS